MKQRLEQKKMNKDYSFTDDELKWMIAHIGDEDSFIRDELIFHLLASSITCGGLTQKQFLFVKELSIREDLIFYQIQNRLPDTLTRSFSALLYGFMLQADGSADSPYYHLLTASDRTYYFDRAIDYLRKEPDKTGYAASFGWVHAFAHGGDYLSQAVTHDLFPKNKSADVLATLTWIINEIDAPFLDCEERRLAQVIYSGLLSGSLSQKEVQAWIDSFEFPLQENADFYRLAMFQNMLAYVYFHSLHSLELDEKLATSMMVYLREY